MDVKESNNTDISTISDKSSNVSITLNSQSEIGIASHEDTAFDPVKGERAMWQAVITQALMDARCESKKCEAIHDKRQAISWLLGRSPDFITVCHHANLDPAYVIKKVKQSLARNCRWRADNKKTVTEAPQ